MRPAEHVKEAARAHSNLNTFAAVVSILEGGCVYGPNVTANRIIAMCKKEMGKQLRIYDRHVAKAQGAAK